MRFAGLLVSTCMIYSSVAVAGFEWLPPKKATPKPPISQPQVSPPKEEANSDSAPAVKTNTPSAEEIVNRIFDYESGKINAHDMQKERDKRIEKIVKIREEIKQQALKSEIKKRDDKLEKQKEQIAKLKKRADLLTVHQPYAPHIISDATAAGASDSLQVIPINPSDKPVIGFGTQMPLALTLNDIIPDQYSFSFGSNVDPGMAVSWEGYHRPWTIVLAETLKNSHLVARVDGTKLAILADPSMPRRLPPMLHGSNFPARLNINPMPAPTPIDFNHNASLSPFVSAQGSSTDQPKSLLAPTPSISKKPIKINSFPLGKNPGLAPRPAPTSNDKHLTPQKMPLMPMHTAPPAKAPLVIRPTPAFNGSAPKTSHDEVYISRHESQRRAAQHEKNHNFFNPFTAIRDLIAPKDK